MRADFSTLDDVTRLMRDLPVPDPAALEAARARDAELTKPPGALGRLEDLAIWYCAWRGAARARVEAPQVVVFAGNHGVCAQGISAFPAAVTAQMVDNFRNGGAAVNQLAGVAGARMDVHALELDRPTGDISLGPAMTEAEVIAALRTGWEAVDAGTDLLVAGEMGIGNTTSAAAIALALHGGAAGDWTGRGTGLDDAGLGHKARIVSRAVAVNAKDSHDGLEVLRRLGGREIAAMAGRGPAGFRSYWTASSVPPPLPVSRRRSTARSITRSPAMSAPSRAIRVFCSIWTRRRCCRLTCGWVKARAGCWQWGSCAPRSLVIPA